MKWNDQHAIVSGHNEAGRGMELSELVEYEVRLSGFLLKSVHMDLNRA